MKKLVMILIIATYCNIGYTQSSEVPSKEVQIKTAVLAAPEGLREKALVYGYSDKGEFVVLRQGSNEMVCIADDPNQAGLNVSCYHKDLEPFMARGRDLKKEGKNFKEVFDIRESEVKSGKLLMPKQPTSLFVYSAKDEEFNKTTGDVTNGSLRYVVYIPYATSESTGLPLKPEAPGMPWIMDPGTHRAHIMINPPAKN
ncbi:MAG TPA: hypothetical protein VK589_13275 [Chryseolinea sp.]|nr:hypothetical protein [Chryseolinea sp.]